MITRGARFRPYGPADRAQGGDQLRPRQHAALRASEPGRTETRGGHGYTGAAGNTTRYSYHSCRTRPCPTGQQAAAQAWRARPQDRLLPVPYVLVTVTRPAELRDVAQRHQTTIYDLLLRSAAAAVPHLAHDPRFLGGQIGMGGVVQTWTCARRAHPQVPQRGPGGGRAADRRTWGTANAEFLGHVKPRAALCRAKGRAARRQTACGAAIPTTVWNQPWLGDCRPVGKGLTALKQLAPYIVRVALSNNRIVGLAADPVTFRQTVSATGQRRTYPLPALALIQRFLPHVLPKGCVTVRSDGLFRPGPRQLLGRIRAQLLLQQRRADRLAPPPGASTLVTVRVLVGPMCGPPLRLERVLRPHNRGPPQCADQGLRQHPGLWWRRRRAARHPQAWFSVPCRQAHAHAQVRLGRCPAMPVRVRGVQRPICRLGRRACGQTRPR